jgi:hypothetical protein
MYMYIIMNKVVIGVVVLMILLGIGAFIFIRRRRAAKKKEEEAKAAAAAAAAAAEEEEEEEEEEEKKKEITRKFKSSEPISIVSQAPDSVKPVYKLRNAQTGANDWGGGNMIFLDRHTLDCGDDGLNQFRLGRPKGNQIQYKYKCLDGINSPANIRKDTGANDWGGGNTIYLDRHNLDCGKNPIAKFRLVRPKGNQIRYDYTCNSKKVGGACRNVNTGWNQESNQQIYLDRHNVKCNDNEVITQFKLNRDGKGKFRYDYKCCKM